MLCHTDIVYSAEGLERLYSGLGVKLHGAVMGLIPTEFAERLHHSEYQPFSLFCIENPADNTVMVRISSLNEEAELICRSLSAQQRIKIYGMKKPLERVACQCSESLSAEALFAAPVPRVLRVEFISPAVYRSSGKCRCNPELARYLRSVTEKLAYFEGLRSEIDTERLLNYVSTVSVERYSLNGEQYNVSGSIYSGMTGWMELAFTDRSSENATLLNAVMRYAEYSGIGAKTAVGMGGVSVSPIE